MSSKEGMLPQEGGYGSVGVGLSDLTYDHPEPPSIHSLRPDGRAVKPLLEPLHPSLAIEQAFAIRAQDYQIDMADDAPFWQAAGKGFKGPLGEVSTWLKGVQRVSGDENDTGERVFIGEAGQGISFSWKEVEGEIAPDAKLHPRILAARLVDGAAKLAAVREAIKSTGSTLGLSMKVDWMIDVSLKAAQGVLDGRVAERGGSVEEALQWGKRKLVLAYGERVGAAVVLGATLAGCTPPPESITPVGQPENTQTTITPGPEATVHSTPVVMGLETPGDEIISTPTAVFDGQAVDDQQATRVIDISFNVEGQAGLDTVKETLIALGYDLNAETNKEWLQIIENGAETVQRDVPGAVDVDLLLEGSSWGLVPRDAQGNIIWAHDSQGQPLWAPVFFDSADLTQLGGVPLESGDLQPEYKSIPNTKDAQVEMVGGFPTFVRFGFTPNEQNPSFNSYVQVLDDGEWVWNEYALMAFAENSDVMLDKSNQPYADHGVVVDDDGALWMYDEANHVMVDMHVDPNWTGASYSRTEDGQLQVTLDNGDVYHFSPSTGEWDKIEKVYTSCADPELLEEIRNDFTESTQSSPDEFIQKLISQGKYDQSFALFSEKHASQADYMVMGTSEISLEGRSGASKGDSAFCVYLVDDSDTSTMIPVVVAYTLNGQFYKTTWIVDGFGEGSKSFQYESMSDLRDLWQNGKVSPGDVIEFNYYNFKDVNGLDKISQIHEEASSFMDNMKRLLKLMGADYLSRVSGLDSPVQAAKVLDPATDIGLFPRRMYLTEHDPLK